MDDEDNPGWWPNPPPLEETDLKAHLIEISGDPNYPLSTTERALYSLLSLPIIAQSACTEDEREKVIRTVNAAIDASVAASLKDRDVVVIEGCALAIDNAALEADSDDWSACDYSGYIRALKERT